MKKVTLLIAITGSVLIIAAMGLAQSEQPQKGKMGHMGHMGQMMDQKMKNKLYKYDQNLDLKNETEQEEMT